MLATPFAQVLRFATIVAAAAVIALGCNDLTAPAGENPIALSQTPGAPSSSRADNKSAPAETVAANHILVAYKGAKRAAPQVTRTKDEARAEAARLAALARERDADFEALAKAHSDDPGSAPRGGALGSFPREAMTRPFSDAAFALQVGEISDPVETEFGFHVIKRVKLLTRR